MQFITFRNAPCHYSRGYAIARCQAKTTLKSYWHELRDHQEYSKKIAMKTGTHTQVPVPMTIVPMTIYVAQAEVLLLENPLLDHFDVVRKNGVDQSVAINIVGDGAALLVGGGIVHHHKASLLP